MVKKKKESARADKGRVGAQIDPAEYQRFMEYARNTPVSKLFHGGQQLTGAMFVWRNLLPPDLQRQAVIWAKHPEEYDPRVGDQLKAIFARWRSGQGTHPPE